MKSMRKELKMKITKITTIQGSSIEFDGKTLTISGRRDVVLKTIAKFSAIAQTITIGTEEVKISAQTVEGRKIVHIYKDSAQVTVFRSGLSEELSKYGSVSSESRITFVCDDEFEEEIEIVIAADSSLVLGIRNKTYTDERANATSKKITMKGLSSIVASFIAMGGLDDVCTIKNDAEDSFLNVHPFFHEGRGTVGYLLLLKELKTGEEKEVIANNAKDLETLIPNLLKASANDIIEVI